MIENIRKCYKECEPFLTTIKAEVERADVVKQAKVEALKSIAKTLLRIDLLEVKIIREKELGKELSIDEQIELLESEIKKRRKRKTRSRENG